MILVDDEDHDVFN